MSYPGPNPPAGSPCGRKARRLNHQRLVNHSRRLERHYETTLNAHERVLILNQIALQPIRLDYAQLSNLDVELADKRIDDRAQIAVVLLSDAALPLI